MQELLIADAADQEFTTILSDVRCTFRFRYNPTADRWTFDLAIGDDLKLLGRRIVTDIDLIAPFDLGIGALVALDVEGRGNLPDRKNLPARKVRLYSLDATEIAQVRALP